MQSVEQCSWACLRAIDYLKHLTKANRRYSFVIQTLMTNLEIIGLYYTLKILHTVNTLISLVNRLMCLSERFYIDTARVGFTPIEICKALSVDFVDTIVYSIACIGPEIRRLMPLRIC